MNASFTHPFRCWLVSLKSPGRLLVPLTIAPFFGAKDNASGGQMLLVNRHGASLAASFVCSVSIYPSVSGRNTLYNNLLAQRFRETLLGMRDDVQSVRLDEHTLAETCWLHGDGFCLSAIAPAEP